MKPMVKSNLSIPQDDIITHNLNLEFDLDTYHPLPSLSHDPLSLNMPNQYLPSPTSEQVQGSHISYVEEQEGWDYFDLSSLFQNPTCEDGVSSFLAENESGNLGCWSNTITSPN